MGLTVQIISPSDSWDWVQSVICHEVAHLFFYQATHNDLSLGPGTWISEGYAQYHERISNDGLGEMVQQAADRGELIPLRLASGSFSGADERVGLLYAESWSAVTFLYDRWGADGMVRLMEAFRDGPESSDALRAATGLDFKEFQPVWWEWLGGMPGACPTPLARATSGTLPSLEPYASAAIAGMTPGPSLAGGTAPPEAGRRAWPCAGGAAALLLGMAAIILSTRASRR